MTKLGDSTRDFIHEWSLNILILLFGTTTLVQAFIVPTGSMESTVLIGDHLLVDKLSYAPAGSISKYLLPYTEPKRGDVIVFRYPMDIRQNFVKRVIGVPGDHIHIVDKVVYVNGHALTEPYTQHIDAHIEPYRDNFPSQPYGPVVDRAQQMLAANVSNGELVVPAESYFAMGDNRENSLDSRYWGFVPRENIIGKPLVIFWSYDAPTEEWAGDSGSHYVDLAKNFFSKTRWNRTLKLIRGIPIQ
ncbi:MAG: signal peptidase I [Acidobacteriota bacterium]|nr:signal peptidase I [Acidobacteriota bacterium]